MVTSQSSLSVVRLWPISNVMLAKIRVIKCHAWGHQTIIAEVKLESLPRCAPAVHSYLSQQCSWVPIEQLLCARKGPLHSLPPISAPWVLPCGCSSAYLCTKVKLEKLGVSQNLALMCSPVLWLCAGMNLPRTCWVFLLPLGHMATLKWFLQNSCCDDAAAREKVWD